MILDGADHHSGALKVFTVVVAIDLLGTGEPGVGTLTAAIGAGAVLRSLGASLLVGTRRLGAWFAVGVTLWGLPVSLIGVVTQQAAALFLLVVVATATTPRRLYRRAQIEVIAAGRATRPES
jgi:hypothetical protein